MSIDIEEFNRKAKKVFENEVVPQIKKAKENKMKQTAVEWLYNNLKSHFEHDGDLLEIVQMSFEQAKAMEKEQIEDAFEYGQNSISQGWGF
jgi:hypothetical protein